MHNPFQYSHICKRVSVWWIPCDSQRGCCQEKSYFLLGQIQRGKAEIVRTFVYKKLSINIVTSCNSAFLFLSISQEFAIFVASKEKSHDKEQIHTLWLGCMVTWRLPGVENKHRMVDAFFVSERKLKKMKIQLLRIFIALLAVLVLWPVGVNARTYKGTITIEVGEDYTIDLGFSSSPVSSYWSKTGSAFIFTSNGSARPTE